MPRTKLLVLCIAMALLAVGVASAQTYSSDFKVDYFANANTAGAPDATVRMDNPGTAGGGICADIFVFDSAEEMSECCSCYLSPDDLRTLSVNGDLTANPGNGVTVTGGVIKVLSTTYVGSCPAPTGGLTLTYEVKGWTTHVQNSTSTITETAMQDADLSSKEFNTLEWNCKSIHAVDSGRGICTCGTGS